MRCVRFAVPEDEEALRALAAVPMPGAVSISFPHEPDYFAAEALKGTNQKIFVWADQGTGSLYGCGLRSEKKVYMNGEPTVIGYIGSLRLLAEERGGRALFSGFRKFHEYHRIHPMPFYLTTVVKDNASARKILTGGRAGLPIYHPQGIFRTFVFTQHGLQKMKYHFCEYRSGSEIGIGRILDFYRSHSRERNFFPVLDVLPGYLKLEDMIVIVRENEILGCAALADMQRFRQIKICSYSRPLSFARPFLNCFLKWFRFPQMPSSGSFVPHKILGLWCVKNNSADIFLTLLSTVRERLASELLMFAVHKNDPLYKTANRLNSWHYDSIAYTVSWEKFPVICCHVPYLELMEV